VVKRLSKNDVAAIRRLEKQRRIKPYITYNKEGVVSRHKFLFVASRIAKTQASRGRRSFVDKDIGKFIRSIKIFEPKRKKKK